MFNSCLLGWLICLCLYSISLMSFHYCNNEKCATIVWGVAVCQWMTAWQGRVTDCQLFVLEEEFFELLGGEPAVQGTPMCHGDGSCLLRHDYGDGIGLLCHA